MALRHAFIVAASVEVHCPYCGGPQVDPEIGSFLWTLDQVRAAASVDHGDRTCIECDLTFRIVMQSAAKLLCHISEACSE